jgi:hypothetical protein
MLTTLTAQNSVFLDGTTDRTIKSLCSDVERVIEFLDSHLPSDFVQVNPQGN